MEICRKRQINARFTETRIVGAGDKLHKNRRHDRRGQKYTRTFLEPKKQRTNELNPVVDEN